MPPIPRKGLTGWARVRGCVVQVCLIACAHGDCVLTDTCSCDPGWVHNEGFSDCARPLCPAVDEEGCAFGCCNGGNCTAPATCTCATGFSGQDCRDHVCEPTWDHAKMAAFDGPQPPLPPLPHLQTAAL